MPSVQDAAGEALVATTMEAKCALVREIRSAWLDGDLANASAVSLVAPDERGRPTRPVLVEPRQLRSRSLRTRAGQVAAVHAVAHIEANAVDLAVDAVHRFGGLPDAFVDDWLRVAAEEARHFGLLADRLRDLGSAYGELPAHGGLWDACARTAGDPLRRMALVPRVLEARGLDVNPPMIERFDEAGDRRTAEILREILDDEIGHVAVGDRWFRWLCHARGLEAEATFAELLDDAGVTVRPPLNRAARLAAGFGVTELDRWEPPGSR